MLPSPAREQAIYELVNTHHLKENDIYLLEFIPLIEMIWADGKNQQAEIDLLYNYALEHISHLEQLTGGESPVSVEDVNAFINRFMHHRPHPQFLKDLRHYTQKLCFSSQDEQQNTDKKQTLLHYCMDIAAASVTSYPYDKHARIMESEKNLLLELMQAFQLSPDITINNE